jgi:hypothetical protein
MHPDGIAQTITYKALPIKDDLLLKHQHAFTGSNLTSEGVLASKLRICPHLTTSTARQSKSDSLYSGNLNSWSALRLDGKNSPMLTHAINAAFPPGRRSDPKKLKKLFRAPYARESSQIDASRKPEDFWWCRSCPTKFRVFYDAPAEQLKVDVYHNFGKNPMAAKQNFQFLVRGSRNCEFAGLSRTFPDFECGEDASDDRVDLHEDGASERGLLLAVRMKMRLDDWRKTL